MKLLLDESIPRKLTSYFPSKIEVLTVPQMDWAGTKNGKLLALAAEAGFTALITADRGIEYQHNPDTLPIFVVVLRGYRTRLEDLRPLVPLAISALEQASETGVIQIAL